MFDNLNSTLLYVFDFQAQACMESMKLCQWLSVSLRQKLLMYFIMDSQLKQQLITNLSVVSSFLINLALPMLPMTTFPGLITIPCSTYHCVLYHKLILCNFLYGDFSKEF